MARDAQDPLVRLRDVALSYGRQPVLDGVSFAIRPGEFWFVLGPNGSGKSTLLKGILGMLPVRGGEVSIDAARVPRERIGFVPQRGEFKDTLPTTVREFVTLGLVGCRVQKSDEPRHLAWALERVGLAGFERRDYAALSFGQRQRTLLARALIRRPSLIVLDEPTSGLDPQAQRDFLGMLAEMTRAGQLTVLFVTHQLPMAIECATHLAVVHGGRVRTGERREIVASREFWELFPAALDSPAGAPAAAGEAAAT
ncbi:MAG: ATP-binding cassette domain-containing protein [Planctomycetes bacterium]|nr:ATP-binding cassette domain-containing protein [Planctomycetota bacterium]